MMNSPLLAVALPLFLLTACANVQGDQGGETAYETLASSMRGLEAAKKRFTAAHPTPQTIEFAGQGKVTIRELSLDGYPGNSYVRCRFHYENNTGRPVTRSLVSLDILDAAGEMIASQVSVCIFPTPRAIHDGTFYADELRTQTHGVHEQEGWTYRVTCKTEFMEEPAAGSDPR